jgi:phosphoribosylaminoimidazole-succinocarboxamide synthase
MKIGEQLYRGKAKTILKTEDKDLYVMHFNDDATAFNGEKKGTITDKGYYNCQISKICFDYLEQNGIPTHMVKLLNDREILVKSLEILQVEVIVRNYTAGSMAKRLGLEEGKKLSRTIMEFCLKSDELGDPLINEDHALALELITEEQLNKVKEETYKINDLLKKRFDEAGLILVDFKLEFGVHNNEVLLGDEISPDTCRLWDKETKEKLDKDRFRRDLGKVEDAYNEVLRRLK